MDEVTFDPVELSKLRSLQMTVFGFRKPPFIDSIYHVYETLATSSNLLEDLRIKTYYAPQFHHYEGGKMAKLIIRNHGPTIRSIIMDEMILSSENLAYICSNCPNLEALGFSLTKRLSMVSDLSNHSGIMPYSNKSIKTGLSTALSFSNRIAHLRLTVNRRHSTQILSEYFHLMRQDLSQLSHLHVRSYEKLRNRKSRHVCYSFDYKLWKVRRAPKQLNRTLNREQKHWSYDQISRSPKYSVKMSDCQMLDWDGKGIDYQLVR
jgi:hypothetical protein